MMGDDARKSNANRASKRAVIEIGDDDDSTQPIVKREAEPVPSAEMNEMQQKNRKLEDDFQRACRAAREAELRAEAAENRLDAKYGIREGFDAEKKRADDLEKKLVEVSQENEALKTAIADMQKEQPESELAQENKALKTEMTEMKKEHGERIDELTQQVTHYKEVAAATHQPKVVRGLVLYENGDPYNILQLCDSNSIEATSFSIARNQILSVAENYEEFQSSTRNWFGDGWLADVLHDKEVIPTVYCGGCQKPFNDWKIIRHFVSDKHYDKVSSLGAAVSTAALEYWLDKLQPTLDVMMRLQQKKDAAAAAEAARSGEQIAGALTNGDDMGVMLSLQPAADARPVQQPNLPVLAAAVADPSAGEEPIGIKNEEIDD